jgi:hypothetical protein
VVVLVLRIAQIIVMGPSLKIERLLGEMYPLRIIDVVACEVGR